MADIDLVIRIPKIDYEHFKELYESLPKDTIFVDTVAYYIGNGTPLNEVLDEIRAEIDEQIKYNTYFNSDMSKGEIIAFEWVKRKIDEYTKGEQ